MAPYDVMMPGTQAANLPYTDPKANASVTVFVLMMRQVTDHSVISQ